MRTNRRRHKKFVLQRMKQLEMEFKYLELLSEEEKEYLRKEQKTVRYAKFVFFKKKFKSVMYQMIM